ncbi:hypothetical protein ACFIOY_20925 [Bradyrhizobium sp. TZ2]
MNHTTITETEVLNNEIADYLQEMQRVVEHVILDLRQEAEFLERRKPLRLSAEFLNSDADLLSHAWLQLHLNLSLMSHQ